MRPATVCAWRPTVTRDEFGQPVDSWTPEMVDGVLWAPTATVTASVDVEDMGGVTDSDVVFHFPKSYGGGPLAGAVIETPPAFAGRRDLWDVEGDPSPYMAANTPGRWNMVVRANRRPAAAPEVGDPPWRG
jgi:hypothetical protein